MNLKKLLDKMQETGDNVRQMQQNNHKIKNKKTKNQLEG